MCIQGGLGNQLYTYSLGKAISAYLGVEMVLDTQDYCTRTDKNGLSYKWPYYLDKLNVPERVADASEVMGEMYCINDREEAVYSPNKILNMKTLYRDGVNIITMGDDWRYHEPVIGALREQLVPLPVNGNRDLMYEIRSCESVGMHIRLGDYVTNPQCLVLPRQYYQDCVTVLRRSVDNPRIYIFTDSPDLVRDATEADLPVTLVEGNDPVTDMALLSACKHKILSNSSFSFWGARLDGRKGGITLCPEDYFLPGGKSRFKDTPSVSWPPEWRVIPVRMPDGWLETLQERR